MSLERLERFDPQSLHPPELSEPRAYRKNLLLLFCLEPNDVRDERSRRNGFLQQNHYRASERVGSAEHLKRFRKRYPDERDGFLDDRPRVHERSGIRIEQCNPRLVGKPLGLGDEPLRSGWRGNPACVEHDLLLPRLELRSKQRVQRFEHPLLYDLRASAHLLVQRKRFDGLALHKQKHIERNLPDVSADEQRHSQPQFLHVREQPDWLGYGCKRLSRQFGCRRELFSEFPLQREQPSRWRLQHPHYLH